MHDVHHRTTATLSILLHRLRIALPFCLFPMLPCSTTAQQGVPPPPKREVRAVWIATTAGLDWPRTLKKQEQQSALLRIVDNLKSANFNTIYFQVRPRGDAYYRSTYEPWAENLTGTLGKDPGWDPLAFLLAEAHRLGMEVHAWFNLYKIRGATASPPSIPAHPSRSLSRWAVLYQGEMWLDPGAPEVNAYLMKVALDLVRNYAIDGINFDFARYPGRDFPDDESYRRYGRGANRDDWRRANVTGFISAFYDSAIALKPMLKIGSSPLGVYETTTNGQPGGSFTWFCQDAPGWLRARKQDYVTPQLYWPIGSSGNDPDFAQLARQWRQYAAGRQVYAGIGAFKDDVYRQIASQIEAARAAGTDGESYYRYENLKSFAVLGDCYASPANIPPMAWKDSIPPLPPTNLAVTEISANVFHLEWTPPPAARDGDHARAYDVYRWNTPRIPFDDDRSLVAITTTADNFFVDTVKIATGIGYCYAVTALDKGNNESPPSNVVTIAVREAVALKGKLFDVASLSTVFSTRDGAPTLVGYQLNDRMPVSLRLYRTIGAGTDSLVATLVDDVQEKGTYVLGLRRTIRARGAYVLRLKAGEETLEQPVELLR